MVTTTSDTGLIEGGRDFGPAAQVADVAQRFPFQLQGRVDPWYASSDLKSSIVKGGAVSVDSVISAFSAEHVTRITGLTSRQLRLWDTLGFFKPTYAYGGGGKRPLRVYSFKDVVGLRVLGVLLTEHGIPLQKLKKVARELSAYSDNPWSTLRLMVCQGEVSFIDPKTGQAREVLTGQGVLMPIIDQIHHVRRAAADLSRRGVDQIGAMERHRTVVHNARVFSGTRVPVRAIERFLAAGYSVEAILVEYPSLQRNDIEAVSRELGRQVAA